MLFPAPLEPTTIVIVPWFNFNVIPFNTYDYSLNGQAKCTSKMKEVNYQCQHDWSDVFYQQHMMFVMIMRFGISSYIQSVSLHQRTFVLELIACLFSELRICSKPILVNHVANIWYAWVEQDDHIFSSMVKHHISKVVLSNQCSFSVQSTSLSLNFDTVVLTTTRLRGKSTHQHKQSKICCSKIN